MSIGPATATPSAGILLVSYSAAKLGFFQADFRNLSISGAVWAFILIYESMN